MCPDKLAEVLQDKADAKEIKTYAQYKQAASVWATRQLGKKKGDKVKISLLAGQGLAEEGGEIEDQDELDEMHRVLETSGLGEGSNLSDAVIVGGQSEDDTPTAQTPERLRGPANQSTEEIDMHNLTHLPYRTGARSAWLPRNRTSSIPHPGRRAPFLSWWQTTGICETQLIRTY